MIRKAKIEDLTEIRRIYDSAKKFMNEHGNPNQWVIGYPPTDILTEDIEKGQLYVIGEDRPHGVFALIEGKDPTYGYIEGKWISGNEYVTIHRIAGDGTLKGILHSAVSFAKNEYPNADVRIDTHKDNTVMQGAIKKEGFEYCGIIYLENGDPRMAYLLKSK